MGEPSEHIAAWEGAGLIDAATAARLRAAEVPGESVLLAGTPSGAAAMFGPAVTIPELFGYLGAAFLLAGWTTFVTRSDLAGENPALRDGLGAGIAAVVLIGLGLLLRRGDASRRRATGVAFLLAVAYAGVGAGALAGLAGMESTQRAVVAAVVALAVAIGVRRVHPAVLTQVALVSAISVLAWALLNLLQSIVVPDRFTDDGTFIPGGPDPITFVAFTAVWWLMWALLIGLVGLAEARAAARGDEAAGRRAAVTRFWAGMFAVVGLATALNRSDYNGSSLDYQRVLEPLIGQLALVLLSLVLLERAFRRNATAFVYPAALGLIIALSDFNFTYLSDSTEVGLVIEGLILLSVGIAADRLRRRVGRVGTDATVVEGAHPVTGDMEP